LEFFQNIPRIRNKLETLNAVGLGYVKMGQAATTLSGGEAQRIKLSKELSRRATGNTFYILDEPTTGLHFEDVRKLLMVLHELVNMGNTVLVIEHNLDVIKSCDWLIDMGPEGGNKGGHILVEGTPEHVAASAKSYTGRFLAPILDRDRAWALASAAD
jgi:excinuclease ABC subunit A